MSSQSPNTLEERVAKLEEDVTEIGHVLYDLIRELRERGNIDALPAPPCPPICPRG